MVCTCEVTYPELTVRLFTVSNHVYACILYLTMAELNIPISRPTLNADSLDVYTAFLQFREQVEVLFVDGPYSELSDKQKVGTLLNWMGCSHSKILKEDIIMEDDKSKDKLEDVLDAFQGYFRPSSGTILAWYNLGSLHSNSCKNQVEFMQRIRHLAKECNFTNQDEVSKFLFLIHNQHKRVQDQLIKEMRTTTSLAECLQIAKWVEDTIQAERLAQQLQQGSVNSNGKTEVASIQRGHSKSKKGPKGKGYKYRSQSRSGKSGTNICNNCKTSHLPRQCPAFGKTCYKCNKKGHYAKCCRSNTTTNSGYTKPGFDRWSRKSVNKVKMYDTDSETYVYDSVVIKCRIRFVDQSARNNIMFDEIRDCKSKRRILTDLILTNKDGSQCKT